MIILLININVRCYRTHNLRSYDVILHICTRGFGILANFDAVLRFLTFLSCGFAVFDPPYVPLHNGKKKVNKGISQKSNTLFWVQILQAHWHHKTSCKLIDNIIFSFTTQVVLSYQFLTIGDAFCHERWELGVVGNFLQSCS